MMIIFHGNWGSFSVKPKANWNKEKQKVYYIKFTMKNVLVK